ncbi:hypothetical protein [Streptomyces mirabilis]|uniref:hypothetical protein n=1 Tax=Streptomyces mirabilis TaxID=68239 RepID=UPI00224E7E95|nr:hypothetical protein [Streptomyces mirabilis]MCX4434495.1 hypothetical protein [Streptomyces mirabilis]
MSEDSATAPPFAQLRAGLTGKDLYDVISRSGYPFQATVADTLRSAIAEHSKGALIQEEWGYVDTESGQTRAVDILAEVPLGSRKERNPLLGARPTLSLILECKQSDLPYVFFMRNNPPASVIDFLQIAGTESARMRVFSANEEGAPGFSYYMTLHDVFGAWEFPFFEAPAPWAISLSKAVRKPKADLTGEEAYRSITLPLMKAADHLKAITKKSGGHRHVLRVIVCAAVVRAPMIGVHLHEGQPNLIAFPWFRVSHLEPAKGQSGEMGPTGTVKYFDVVHEDHLNDYINVLMKSLNPLADRMDGHAQEILSGVGLCGPGDNTWEDLKPLPSEYEQYLEKETWATISREISSLTIGVTEGSPAPPPGHIGWVNPMEHQSDLQD